ncbi:branched-chain amino acid ABC transporter [Burkholderia anthina]|uniref:branched-chain amino acid ABC transporter n=1 Tax=Burkholderia anthina TaxID=179879 RepID=UPI001CF22919|nr:branched-chain amino acid ABC transporter [Burkholderia anthina]MCA8089830.1 branched-chain amino acid ABC transporter [Burkholderia anthina]
MHVKLAYAMSVAAPVAMLAGCSKKSDDGAGRETAAHAEPAASDVRAATTGGAVLSACRIAQSDRDKDNGARLAIEEFNAQGPKFGMQAARHAVLAGDAAVSRAKGTRVARQCAAGRDAAAAGRVDRRTPGFRGNAGNVQMSLIPIHFDSTKQHVAAPRRVAAGALFHSTDSDGLLTKVGCRLRGAGDGVAQASGIGAQTLGGNGMCVAEVVEPADDAARNLICPVAGFIAARTEKGTDFGKPDDGRFGTQPYDFKEAQYTVLDVVTI